jgi:hypothetical protein
MKVQIRVKEKSETKANETERSSAKKGSEKVAMKGDYQKYDKKDSPVEEQKQRREG